MSKYNFILSTIGIVAGISDALFSVFLLGKLSVGHYASLWEINTVTVLTLICLFSITFKK